ncbi:MAG: ribosome recycling factor [Actinobacteria bacterium ATB1]|nr:ribosome recycling factor [Actinobacteria bacterium ATB1]
MRKAVEVTKSEFAGIRTGRASPALVERMKVDYYGTETPLQQLAGFSVPESRILVINVYDRQAVPAVEKAIRESDLGLNPSTDGSLIRLNFPPLTGERRQELVKIVRHKAEDGRVAVRNLRHTAKKKLENIEHDHEISQDELRRSEKELQTLTDKYVSEIDTLLSHKEEELLED